MDNTKVVFILLITFILFICTPPQNPFLDIDKVSLKIEVPKKPDGFNYCINDKIRFKVTIKLPDLVKKITIHYDEDGNKEEQEITTDSPNDETVFFSYEYKEKGLKNVKFTLTFRSTEKRDTLFGIDIGIKPTIKNNKKLLVGGKAILGESLILSIDHEEFGKATYKWYKNSKQLSNRDKSLVFDLLEKNDEGRYYCIVTTDWGKDQSKTFDLNIKSNIKPPTIQIHPQSIQTNIGDSARFFIKAEGNQITYQWQKNKKNILNAHDYFYEVKNLKIEDSATYRCIISNEAGKDTSENAFLKITKNHIDTSITETAPTIIKHPENKEAEEGDTIQFTVIAEGTNLIYQWFKNDKEILNADQAYLKFSPVSKKDSGSYHCVMHNSKGKETSNNVTLTIISKPKILTHPRDTSIITGETATFTVDAEGDNLQYQWLENGKKVKQTIKKTYSIINATLNHNNKRYSCIVTNGHGSDTSNVAILTVIAANNPPKWQIKSADIEIKEGLTASVDLLKYFGKDPDGDQVTFIKKSGPGQVKHNIWSWTPDFNSTPTTKSIITAKDDGSPSMTSDMTITITVKDSVCKLESSVISGKGKIVTEPQGPNFTPGTNVQVTAVPEKNYTFRAWSGDIGNNDSMKNNIQITMNTNKTISSSFIKASETVVLNVDEAKFHGLLYTNGYYFACTYKYPAKLLKFNASNLSDYSSITFPDHNIASDIVYDKKTDKLYIIFGVVIGLQIAEVDPHTLDYKIRVVDTTSSVVHSGQAITTDNNGYLYIGSRHKWQTTRVIKYSLKTYTAVKELLITDGYYKIHSLRYSDNGYLYATGTYTPPWILKINANNLIVEQKSDIGGKYPTDDFALMKDYLFVGLETEYLHEKSGVIYRISTKDVSKIHQISTGTKGSDDMGNGLCFGVRYCLGYIWALFATSPGIITRIDPATLEFKNYQLEYNKPNEIASDGTRLFITYWDKNPGQVQIIHPSYLNGREIKY